MEAPDKTAESEEAKEMEKGLQQLKFFLDGKERALEKYPTAKILGSAAAIAVVWT